MKTLLVTAIAIGAISLSALVASAGEDNKSGHRASIVSPRDPQATVAPPTPPPLSACLTDAALKEKCTVAWNTCVSHQQSNAKACKNQWRTCCNR